MKKTQTPPGLPLSGEERTGSPLTRGYGGVAFADYLTAHLKTPFKYGVNDCVLFAVRWAELASGKKYMPKVTWTNKAEAHRAIADMGGLEAAFDRNLTRINPNFARDGGLAIAGGIAYLFSGAHICCPGKDGLVFKSRLEATCAWFY